MTTCPTQTDYVVDCITTNFIPTPSPIRDTVLATTGIGSDLATVLVSLAGTVYLVVAAVMKRRGL